MARKTYTIQESGSVTLPAEIRKKYNLNPGDEVTFTETEDGILINLREVLINKLLNELGDDLRERGVTLDELIESGRELRGQLLKEHYGIEIDE